MLRNLIEEILLFLLPFAAFATWLVVTKRNPLDFDHWSGRKFALAGIGIALAIASLLYAAYTADRHTGAYEPARMEDGRLVPGRFRD